MLFRLDSVKQKIVNLATAEAENMLGEAMTYTLIDWAKENYDSLMENQPDKKIHEVSWFKIKIQFKIIERALEKAILMIQ